jgi:mediator of RNA polymerase II transcription subunit 31
LELLEQQQKERERERERLEKEKRDKEQREHEQRKRLRKEKERERFLVELEFVQSLANPDYLAHLGRQGVFEQASFRNYLRYLLYWKSPEYIGFIRYPQCLFFLDILTQQDETSVHQAIQAIRRNKTLIGEQQLRHWKIQGANLSSSSNPFEERKHAHASKKTKKT